MDDMYDTYRPEGFHTISPYLMIEDPAGLIRFLEKAFNAEELGRTLDDTGEIIRNAILKIGDSCFMLGQARGEFMGMRTSFYLYVADADKMYQRAVDAGGTGLFAPMDMDYGDRQGGVIDPAGNYWWISTRLSEEAYTD